MQTVEVNNLNFFFIAQNQIKALEAAKTPAYSFNGETQIVANIRPLQYSLFVQYGVGKTLEQISGRHRQ
jgi:hypothetical protein